MAHQNPRPRPRVRQPAAQRIYRNSQIRYAPGAGGETEISCCVKYSVFGFNVLFFLIGFALLLIGVWAQIEKNNIYSHLNKVASPEAGGVPFSCCLNSSQLTFKNFYCGHGVRLKVCLLNVVTLRVLASEHAQSSLNTIYTDGCLPKLQLWLNNNVFLVGIVLIIVAVIQVVGYRDDPDLQVLIDTMQESWHCCGINGADDWDRNTYFSIAAREILGICFAQNLKSDIFAQRAKWYYTH
ncbi:tetraspanin family protein [Ostertagia ostertagi]